MANEETRRGSRVAVNREHLPTEEDSLFRLISFITPFEFVLEKAKWDFVAAVLASFESLKCQIEYLNGPNPTQ